MKAFPTYSYTKNVPEEEGAHYPMVDKKQQEQQPSAPPMNPFGVGSSEDEKRLPSSPAAMHSIPSGPPSLPPPPPPRPVQFMAETLPMQRSTRPLRRRGCLLSCLCVTVVFVIVIIFVFAVYGIPASHCCKCLTAYDTCHSGLVSTDTVGESTCLNQFYSCTASFTNIFFACNNRLFSNRFGSCWIRYYND